MTQRNQAAAETGEVEQTEVRPTSRNFTTDGVTTDGVTPESSTAASTAPGSRARQHSELEHKLARARVVVAHMAPDDPRARLLQVAVLRRDEILLEALLHRLGSPR